MKESHGKEESRYHTLHRHIEWGKAAINPQYHLSRSGLLTRSRCVSSFSSERRLVTLERSH